MSVFSNNQTRHLYVVTGITNTGANNKGTIPTTKGHVQVCTDSDGHLYLKHLGEGGLTRTDLIDPKTVTWARFTAASDMSYKRKAVRVTLDESVNGGLPIASQDYILRIVFKQYASLDEADQYVKHGMVRGVTNMDASTFYKTLLKSLLLNFSREEEKLLHFYGETGGTSAVEGTASSEILTLADIDALGTLTGIIIEEAEQDWQLGTKPLRNVPFEVYTDTVVLNGEELVWGKVKPSAIFEGVSGHITPNGHIIADMEYFYHGERGDQYRGIGWPNIIPTKYMVDPSKEYNAIDIHYAYVGSNESVQKSEKDLTLVIPVVIDESTDKEDRTVVTTIKEVIESVAPNITITSKEGI